MIVSEGCGLPGLIPNEVLSKYQTATGADTSRIKKSEITAYDSLLCFHNPPRDA